MLKTLGKNMLLINDKKICADKSSAGFYTNLYELIGTYGNL